MNKLMTAAVLTVAFLSGAANASTFTQTKNFVSTDRLNLNFSAFDPSLVTFTSATLEVTGSVSIESGSISGRTEDVAGGSFINDFDTIFDATVFVSGRLFATSYPFNFFTLCSTATAGDTCTASYRGGEKAFSLFAKSTIASEFESPFSVPFTASTDLFAVYGTAVGKPTSIFRATRTATLTYTYEPALLPLPASLPLALGGLALLGAVARRRKQA